MANTNGIKNWQKCPACLWEGAEAVFPELDDCPNCGYTHGLHMEVDFHVWNGKRYEGIVRNAEELAEELAWVARENRPTPLDDVVLPAKAGFQFEPGQKPKYKPKRKPDISPRQNPNGKLNNE